MIDSGAAARKHHRAWSHAWRVAAMVSIVAVVLMCSLQRFVAIPSPVLLASAALAGLAIGVRLPAAAPKRISLSL